MRRHVAAGVQLLPELAQIDLKAEIELVRVFVGQMAGLALIDRQLRLDAPLPGRQTAGQQHEDADVRQHESGLPPPPGKPDQQGEKHVDGQQDVDRSEPRVP